MESVYLQGAEDVRRAAGIVHEAANSMRMSALTIDEAVNRLGRHVDELVQALNAPVRWEYRAEVVEPVDLLNAISAAGEEGWRMVQTQQYPERRIYVLFERRLR